MAAKLKKSIKPVFDPDGNVLNKDEMINREKERLLQIFKEYSPEKMVAATPIISTVAFQTVAMIELESILKKKGFVEEYKNGENQFGLKESSESKSYINLARTCLTYRKQLLDMLDKGMSKADTDELLEFLSGDM